jgi:hypothetical protein
MHTDIGTRPSVSSLATDIQGWIKPLATQMQLRIASLAKKAKEAMVLDLSANGIHNVIPPIAVLAGPQPLDSGGAASVPDCSPALPCSF